LLINVCAPTIDVATGVFIATATARGGSGCRCHPQVATAKLPPPSFHRCRQAAAAAAKLPPPPHHAAATLPAAAVQPPSCCRRHQMMLLFMLISTMKRHFMAKKNEIGFTQNNLSIRVRSVPLDYVHNPTIVGFLFSSPTSLWLEVLQTDTFSILYVCILR
jgi:hypothetical protein